MFNVTNFTTAELSELKKNIDVELSKRKDERRDELIKKFCAAANELMNECPEVGLYIDPRCDEWNASLEIDVLEFFASTKIEPTDFTW